jgi:hypothetical protein
MTLMILVDSKGAKYWNLMILNYYPYQTLTEYRKERDKRPTTYAMIHNNLLPIIVIYSTRSLAN